MFGCCLLEAYDFLMRDIREVDPEQRGGDKEAGGVESGETIM